MDRRGFLQQSAGVVAGVAVSGALPSAIASAANAPGMASGVLVAPDAVLNQRYPFTLPPLPYAANAVEPAVDAQTMGIHHDRHHAAYVTNLNTALASQSALHQYTLGELLMGLRRWPAPVQTAIRNNGGGHANHALFWNLLAPGAATAAAPTGRLAEMITRDFESVAALKAAMKTAAVGQFGSGWAWLVKTATNRLAVRGLPNQDSPLLEGELPIVGIDVWEHAYYLKYQNRRADYVDALLARINWDVAGAQVG
ncbi:MAG: superoxide dismutase [Gemmatimonas sp.]|nr:superoxide dismutase [Gemmatimonas sp.]MCZ8013694.1 superoxide dismutase [Gemmatimonas sp.]MCZ8267567.1 superoxide dismutase [Gemmatimonas sp.]